MQLKIIKYFNAKELVEKDASLIKTQNELHEKNLLSIIKDINLKLMSEKLSSIITKNGIKEIIDTILKG